MMDTIPEQPSGENMESAETLEQVAPTASNDATPLRELAALGQPDTKEQTYDPQPRREKRRHGMRPRAKLRSLDTLDEHAKNRYEGVLIAAARARQLNAKKVAYEERGLEEATDLKRYKMTSHALNELLDGQIEVIRPEEGFEE